jgi:hypothetical protein
MEWRRLRRSGMWRARSATRISFGGTSRKERGLDRIILKELLWKYVLWCEQARTGSGTLLLMSEPSVKTEILFPTDQLTSFYLISSPELNFLQLEIECVCVRACVQAGRLRIMFTDLSLFSALNFLLWMCLSFSSSDFFVIILTQERPQIFEISTDISETSSHYCRVLGVDLHAASY